MSGVESSQWYMKSVATAVAFSSKVLEAKSQGAGVVLEIPS
jgi:hypothetical protein